jgi:hypothetical protein
VAKKDPYLAKKLDKLTLVSSFAACLSSGEEQFWKNFGSH